MPIHDWNRVPAGLFHDFHQSWSIRIKDALNAGRLPKGLIALVEQRAGPLESDVLAIEAKGRSSPGADESVSTLDRPLTLIVRRTTKEIYAGRGIIHLRSSTTLCQSCVIPVRRRSRWTPSARSFHEIRPTHN